jgi:hypothetical protein
MSDPSHPDTSQTEPVQEDGLVDEIPVEGSPPGSAEPPASPEQPAVEDEIPEEIRQEVAVGGTASGVATNNALRSLSRAARSFLLYEPRNQAIRDFLQDYRENMQAALKTYGAMQLDIRPFEMTREGEVVYLERERERSLAFRLFRDGVRSIKIEPEVKWEELLRLLEILSIRYTGIRQSEDDIVTLLWKAGFKHIGIVAIEGFAPDEELPQGGFASDLPQSQQKKVRRKGTLQVEAPVDWDLPLPRFDEVGVIAWTEIGKDRLDSLIAESTSTNIPEIAIRLIKRLFLVVSDPTDPMSLEHVAPVLNEIRDFLLSEGQLQYLTSLASLVEQNKSIDEEKMDQELERFADNRALRRIVKSVGKGSETIPPELLSLLSMIPGDPLGQMMDMLVEERGAAPRRLIRMLIEHFAKETWDPRFVFDRMHSESPSVLCDILRAMSRALPEQTLVEAVTLAGHQSSEVQLEVLWVLGRSDDEDMVENTLITMMESDFSEVRSRVLEHFELYGSARVFDTVTEFVQVSSTRGITDRECEISGRVLAAVNPEQAKSMLMGWVRPPGLFKRFVEMPGTQALHRTAVTGLGLLPGDDIDALLRWLSERCGEEMYKLCMMTLVRRRKEWVNRDR